MQYISNVLSMVVAATLLFSGMVHASQPYYFIHTVSSYHLLTPFAAGIVGLWLPYFQIVLGVCIGLGIAENAALGIAATLFVTYAWAQLTVLWRGIDIDCGCFGFVASNVSALSASLPLLLFFTCIIALKSVGRSGPPIP